MKIIHSGSDITPAFQAEDSAVCVFEISERYAPIFDVFMKSFLKHCSSTHNYDIIIFSSDIQSESEAIILGEVSGLPNISLRFFNPHAIVQQYISENPHRYLDLNYYRLALPWILENYDRALNFGVDMIILRDVFDLFTTPMESDMFIAGARDLDYVGRLNTDIPASELALSIPQNYINADVLLYHLKRIRENTQMDSLMDVWKQYRFRLAEQDVLNLYFEDHILFLDGRWNVFPKGMISDERIQMADAFYQQEWEECLADPYIVHFAGTPKPWYDPNVGYSTTWWQYATESCYYPVLINQMIEHRVAKKKKPLLNRVIDCVLPKNTTTEMSVKNTAVWKKLRKVYHIIKKDPDVGRFGKRRRENDRN